MAWQQVLALLLLVGCSAQVAQSFYLPGVAPQDFKKGDAIYLKVNKVCMPVGMRAMSKEHVPFASTLRVKLPAHDHGMLCLFCALGEYVSASQGCCRSANSKVRSTSEAPVGMTAGLPAGMLCTTIFLADRWFGCCLMLLHLTVAAVFHQDAAAIPVLFASVLPTREDCAICREPWCVAGCVSSMTATQAVATACIAPFSHPACPF
jgi:hypothetical protein